MALAVLFSALFLGWNLGKNNLSNLFGTAVGTRMISLKTAASLALVFICLGALGSGEATTEAVLRLSGKLSEGEDALVVCLTAAVLLWGFSRLGVPVSIVQTNVGVLIGWGVARNLQNETEWTLVWIMMSAWLVAPCLASFISFALTRSARFMLRRHPVSVFKRDIAIRIGLVSMGILASYSLGANNVGTITGPVLTALEYQLSDSVVTLLVCGAIGWGCLNADGRVIRTVSRRLFPLSPTEAFIVMGGTTLTLILFTSQLLREGLSALSLPVFPLVPIPVSSVIIGSIVGVSLTRNGYGLRFSVFGRIVLSWILVPALSAVFGFLLTKGIME